MNRFNRLNNLAGWIVFGIALITYSLTVERTASFWDCGEFIACAFKLQVPHPPGAPFFLLLGRFFSMFSFGDVSKVALFVNFLSVLSSAFTILFLFWTITMLARKVIGKRDVELGEGEKFLVLGAGIVGALAYTWSDSFWFSAVEAEVYGLSSFFTAIVIWAAFKWERIEDRSAADRWMLLIAYLVGLSIGVHLLNLVTIPALAIIYYFRRYEKHTAWGVAGAFGVGLLILGVINSGIIPGLPTLAGHFEIFFVNSIGLPYTSGIIIFVVVFLGLIVFGIRYSEKKNKEMLNVGLLALVFVLVGYMSYILVLVRAEFNPPINENNPNDVLSFVSYLKREQYGSRPLIFGPTFVDRPVSQKRGAPMYIKEDGKYKIYDYRPEYVYSSGANVLLPRMYSTQQRHVQLYQQMQNLSEGQKPNLANNISFMLSYQIGHMYWRYFLWNFVGRESDEEGAGTLLPWDVAKTYPSPIANSKAHDNFFMLPFLLGLLGIVFHYMRRKKDLLVLGLLFFLTGVALVIYLNSPPEEPRERDYIYVGSFYIFTMWIGLGVMALADLLQKVIPVYRTRSIAATVIGLLVPGIMVAKGWDNHNRAHRYHSVDFAKNMLNSCAPNAILFTGGDNDTFPLWYAQEVEGFRTDVRVCNLSLLGTDWYIDQMKRKTYESEALPISLDRQNYMYGRNDIIPFYEQPNVTGGIMLKDYIHLVKENHRVLQAPLQSGDFTLTLPSQVFGLKVDKQKIKDLGIVKEDLLPALQDTIKWKIGNRDLYKSDLIMLDIIATNDWERPVYFSATLGGSSYLNLKEFMQLEGYAYRLLPVQVPGATDGYVNSDLMFDRMMNHMAWRELNNPASYYDNTFLGSPVLSARIAFLRLINQLITEGKNDKAVEALKRSLETMPDISVPYDQVSANFIGPALELGEDELARDIADKMSERADEMLNYTRSTGSSQGPSSNLYLYILQSIVSSYQDAGKTEEAKKYEEIFQRHYGMASFPNQ